MKRFIAMFMCFHLVMFTPKNVTAFPVLEIVGIIVGLAGIASDIYHSDTHDVNSSANRKIEAVVKKQLSLGLAPLHNVNSKVNELLIGQNELKHKITFWGRKLNSGQENIKRLVNELRTENQKGHKKTQDILKIMNRSEFNASMRLLLEAASSMKSNASLAEKEVSDAKSGLLKAFEYYTSLRKSESYVSNEIFALIHYGLSIAYMCHNQIEYAIKEVKSLQLIPAPGNGLKRLNKEIKLHISEISSHQAEDEYVRNMKKILKKLKKWESAVASESRRINGLKSQVMKKLSSHTGIKKLLDQDGGLDKLKSTLEELEDQIAMNAYAQVSAEIFEPKQANQSAIEHQDKPKDSPKLESTKTKTKPSKSKLKKLLLERLYR